MQNIKKKSYKTKLKKKQNTQLFTSPKKKPVVLNVIYTPKT